MKQCRCGGRAELARSQEKRGGKRSTRHHKNTKKPPTEMKGDKYDSTTTHIRT